MGIAEPPHSSGKGSSDRIVCRLATEKYWQRLVFGRSEMEVLPGAQVHRLHRDREGWRCLSNMAESKVALW